MPFEVQNAEEWKRTFRRVALVGPPNSWKTSSLRTFPRPIHILSYPGEHGAASIPQEEGITGWIWKDLEPDRLAPVALAKEVWDSTMQIISGKHGPITTFAGDGFHKCYQIFREARFEELKAAFPNIDEDKLGGRAFGEAHQMTYRYFRKVMSSAVPYVVFTMWAAKEKDDPDDKSKNAPTHIWPDLPGEMAKNVMGEFGVVLYSLPGAQIAPGQFREGTWQTRPAGKIWGAGCKIPFDLAGRIPTIWPNQNWELFERHILGTLPEVPKSTPQPKA